MSVQRFTDTRAAQCSVARTAVIVSVSEEYLHVRSLSKLVSEGVENHKSKEEFGGMLVELTRTLATDVRVCCIWLNSFDSILVMCRNGSYCIICVCGGGGTRICVCACVCMYVCFQQ